MNFKKWLKAELKKGKESSLNRRYVSGYQISPYDVLTDGFLYGVIISYRVLIFTAVDMFYGLKCDLKNRNLAVKVLVYTVFTILLPFAPFGWAWMERQRAINSYREWYIEEKANHLHQ